jgi:hypothetical protein
MVRSAKAGLFLVLLVASTALLSAQRGQTGAAGDKACLTRIADNYLTALAAHDPSKVSDRSMNFEPFDLEAAHIYKIFDGKMHEIEAMGFTLPLYSKNGWSPFIK